MPSGTNCQNYVTAWIGGAESRIHASTATASLALAWHIRMIFFDLSSSVSASWVSIVTQPPSNRVLQLPQMPERHSKSMFTPASSAISSSDLSGMSATDLADRLNVN